MIGIVPEEKIGTGVRGCWNNECDVPLNGFVTSPFFHECSQLWAAEGSGATMRYSGPITHFDEFICDMALLYRIHI